MAIMYRAGDLPGCWNRLEPQHRPRFVRAIYPKGLSYQDGTIGTAEKPWWLADSDALSDPGAGLVPPMGFDWNQVWGWMERIETTRAWLEPALIGVSSTSGTDRNWPEDAPLLEWNRGATVYESGDSSPTDIGRTDHHARGREL